MEKEKKAFIGKATQILKDNPKCIRDVILLLDDYCYAKGYIASWNEHNNLKGKKYYDALMVEVDELEDDLFIMYGDEEFEEKNWGVSKPIIKEKEEYSEFTGRVRNNKRLYDFLFEFARSDKEHKYYYLNARFEYVEDGALEFRYAINKK